MGTARRILGHFRELADEGAAVLLITHDLELALEVADRVSVFYQGESVEEITPEEFRRPETFFGFEGVSRVLLVYSREEMVMVAIIRIEE